MVGVFYIKYTKMLSFFMVAEALTSLIYHRPLGKNSSFSIVACEVNVIFLYVKYTKNVKFLSNSRRPHGPDLPSPCRRKLQFQFSIVAYCLMIVIT